MASVEGRVVDSSVFKLGVKRETEVDEQVHSKRPRIDSKGDMDVDKEIDESLYSRQLYVLGHAAMQKMSSSNVLVVGMKGLGVEITKNIVLAGVKSVTIHDPEPMEIKDLSTQYYLSEEHVQTPRDRATAPKLAELNTYVPVKVLEGELENERLLEFQVVVVTTGSRKRILDMNDFAHKHGIKFIYAETRGLFGGCFVDFGQGFEVTDVRGETPKTGMISSVSRDEQGIVACVDELRHGLEDGDYVTFSEVQGMTELNDGKPRKVKVFGPYTFGIGDTSGYHMFTSNGVFTQVKMPKTIDFKSFRETLLDPEMVVTDFAKFDHPIQIHIAFQAVDAFMEEEGRVPAPRDQADAEKVLALARGLAKTLKNPVDVKDDLIREFSYEAAGDVMPMCAVMGGIIAQEVLKACSGKFHPIQQYLYFDSVESLPKNTPPTAESCQMKGTRYDGQIAVFGKAFHEILMNQRQFIVGAGAIGCELLKNFALMGLGTGPQGVIHITDMDTIEKSNLNRQFLFRPWDVSKSKSETAAKAVIGMNRDLDGKIHALQDKVGQDTEAQFNDDFFESLTGVTNALDNVDARLYVDQRCVYYRKPLLDSGTLGTKGNTQVIVPFLTESYASSQDPPEKEIPFCTLRNFPNAIEHTVQWARDKFEGFFVKGPDAVNQYLTNPKYLESLMKDPGGKEVLASIKANLTQDNVSEFADCVRWARLQYEEMFSYTIRQLLFTLPEDSVTSSGQPFWSPPKRCPKPLGFSADDELDMSFIVAAANLRAHTYGIAKVTDPVTIKQILDGVMVPDFVPQRGVKVETDEQASAPTVNASLDEVEAVSKLLPSPESLKGFLLNATEFEKDDDANFHIDFITSTSNLRAKCYRIEPADRHRTKGIAGRIIPAIATTTALVSGLSCLELLKLVDGRQKLEDYKNGFVNLALPFFGFSEPIAAPKQYYNGNPFTLWDRFDIDHNATLGEIIDMFERDHGLDVTMLSCGVSLLYSFMYPKKKLDERKRMKCSEAVEAVRKEPLPAHMNHLVFEAFGSNKDGEDVDLPYIRIAVR